MTMKDLIERTKNALNAKIEARNALTTSLNELRGADTVDAEREAEQLKQRGEIDADIKVLRAKVDEYEAELRNDEAIDRLQAEISPTGQRSGDGQEREQRIEVNEKRTYNRDADPKGVNFLADVAARALNNGGAIMRLERHMDEERSLRGPQIDRAAGTSAFAGLVVPQYLVDMYAPQAKAGRPFADICRKHDLPETGMTASIGRVTTGTSVAVQASEGAAVSETDIDDTLLTVNIQTASGQQTLSRQAVERGIGVEQTTLEDLFRAYGTSLDNMLLNQATNGLTSVATSIAYTDGTPTAPELYPKLLAAPAAVEAALLDQAANDTVAVMHSRRWYWLQSQLTSTWPMFGQPGVAPQLSGVNYAEKYGSGFRGVLPSGAPVVVDNNIATNLGAGTNEDEIYFASPSECHLWEDPSAPMLIRAEQTKAANLQILLVVYGYFAYTHARRPHAQKIAGTGLTAPTF